MQNFTLYSRAIITATKYHSGQFRKNVTGSPYILHPIEVSKILFDAEVDDDNAKIAAVLHDTLEDTELTYDQLVEEFGIQIANIVSEVTNAEGLSKVETKKSQLNKSRTMSPSAKLVKLADKISNLSDLRTRPPLTWKPEIVEGYFVWSYCVSLNLFGLNEKMDEQLRELVRPYGLLDCNSEELETRLQSYYNLL